MARQSHSSPAGVLLPFFVCPGVRDVPLEHAVFPFGSGFSEAHACPMRNCCFWFSGHDLGGTESICDFPAAAFLSVRFQLQPFLCPDFRDTEAGGLILPAKPNGGGT